MATTDRASAVLTIDLAAVAENFRILRQRFAGSALGVAVKADAYGLGAAQVAPALWRAGARLFFVATLDEGIALRSTLADAHIAVLHGLTTGPADAFVEHRLLPVHNSIAEIDAWLAATSGLPSGLHIDTGIARLGMPPREVEMLAGTKRMAGLALDFVMSHLACGDDPVHALNVQQRDRFRDACAALAIAASVPRSLVASAGIFLDPSFHFDLGRPGAALYGIGTQSDRPNPMRPVVTLRGKILQLRDVDSDSTVGYGATHRMTRPGRVATIGAGYADGLLRTLGNRGYAVAGGRLVPVVGRVSMDLLTIDVTDLPDAIVRPGQFVDLIGPGNELDALATQAGTTGYELLTLLGSRYARQYLPDMSGPAA
ncbi:MAG: alanine racemase [Dongiaceae bacterium]